MHKSAHKLEMKKRKGRIRHTPNLIKPIIIKCITLTPKDQTTLASDCNASNRKVNMIYLKYVLDLICAC